MSEAAEKFGQLLKLLGGKAIGGGSLKDLCAAITSSKNEEHSEGYAEVPYSRRLVLVPQCLRAVGRCKAIEKAAEYLCAKCKACKIAAIVDEAEKLGFMGVKILKGGAAVSRLLEDLHPGAVLGVACSFEGSLGVLECERGGARVQFIPLARDGCSDTDVALESVLEAMRRLRTE